MEASALETLWIPGTQIAGSDWTAVMERTEGRMSVFIPGNIVCCVIGIVLQTIGKNIAWKAP